MPASSTPGCLATQLPARVPAYLASTTCVSGSMWLGLPQLSMARPGDSNVPPAAGGHWLLTLLPPLLLCCDATEPHSDQQGQTKLMKATAMETRSRHLLDLLKY